MKAKPPLRKLIEVKEAASMRTIEEILEGQGIPWVKHHSTDPYQRDFWRYKVNKVDLQRAQLALAEGRGKEGAA